MGYDLCITRTEFDDENERFEISEEAWRGIIAQDDELEASDPFDPLFATWKGHPHKAEPYLHWSEGVISSKFPDEHTIAKMLLIAEKLGTRVEGDDGEIYPLEVSDIVDPRSSGFVYSIWCPILGVMLTGVAAIGLFLAFKYDASIRVEYPVGTPLPDAVAMPLIGLTLSSAAFGVAGVLCAFWSILFQFSSWRSYLGWFVVGVNALAFLTMAIMRHRES